MGLASGTGLPVLVHVLLGPLLLLLALFLTIGVSVSSVARLQHASNMVLSSREVLDRSAHLLRLVVDMETGVRGFALTADDAFLQPYFDAQAELNQDLAELSELLADQPEQQARVDAVARTLADWEGTFASEVIRQSRAGDDALELVRRGEGKQRTDVIRSLMLDLQAAEQQALAARIELDREARSQAAQLMVVATAAAFVAAVLAFLAGRGIANQVLAVAQGAQRVALGDLDVRLPVTGSAELSEAAKALNHMAAALAEAQERLGAQNLRLMQEAMEAERARSETRAVLDSARSAVALFSPDHRLEMVNRGSAISLACRLRTSSDVGRRTSGPSWSARSWIRTRSST